MKDVITSRLSSTRGFAFEIYECPCRGKYPELRDNAMDVREARDRKSVV